MFMRGLFQIGMMRKKIPALRNEERGLFYLGLLKVHVH